MCVMGAGGRGGHLDVHAKQALHKAGGAATGQGAAVLVRAGGSPGGRHPHPLRQRSIQLSLRRLPDLSPV